MPGVPWIKLWVGIFDDEKIKIIQSMPEGDTIVLCWLRLLCMAGKNGMGGVVSINETIPYTDEMLANVWGVQVNTVRLAIKTLQELGMVMITDGSINIVNWTRYQSIKSYEDVQEQWKIRQQKHRQKQITDMSRDMSRDVTLQEIEIEERNRIKNKKEKYKEEVDNIILYFNERTGSSVKLGTEAHRKMIRARLGEGYTVDNCKQAVVWCYAKWKGTDMEQYIRIPTIFGAEKFAGYVENWKREMAKDGE